MMPGDNLAIMIGVATIGELEFERGVRDLESLRQPQFDLPLDLFHLLCAAAVDHDVRFECEVMLVKFPDVQVMNLANAIEAL